MSDRAPARLCPRAAHRRRIAVGATLAVGALSLAVGAGSGGGSAYAADARRPNAGAPLASVPLATPAPPPDNSFRWSVQPIGQAGVPGRSYLVHDLAPGTRLDDGVRITNYTEQPMTFTVYGTDAFTTNDGSFSLLPAENRPAGAGTWITPAQGTVTVAPGAGVDVPVTITVPADAEPGDHAAGVIASVATVQADASGRLVQVDRRIAARAYFRVAGPLHPGLQIDDVRISYDNPGNPFPGAGATVTYRVRNTGNARVSAQAEVKVEGPLGWQLGGPTRENVTELLPGAELTRSAHFDGVFPAGQLTASVTVRAGQAPQGAAVPPTATTRTASVWAVPWALVAALLALAVAIAVVLRLRPGRRTGPRPAAVAADGAEGAAGAEASAAAVPNAAEQAS